MLQICRIICTKFTYSAYLFAYFLHILYIFNLKFFLHILHTQHIFCLPLFMSIIAWFPSWGPNCWRTTTDIRHGPCRLLFYRKKASGWAPGKSPAVGWLSSPAPHLVRRQCPGIAHWNERKPPQYGGYWNNMTLFWIDLRYGYRRTRKFQVTAGESAAWFNFKPRFEPHLGRPGAHARGRAAAVGQGEAPASPLDARAAPASHYVQSLASHGPGPTGSPTPFFQVEAVFLYPWLAFSEFVNESERVRFKGFREEGYIRLPPYTDWKERFAVLKSRPMSMFFKVAFPTILLVAVSLQQDTVVAAEFKIIARVNSQFSNIEDLRRLGFRGLGIRTSARWIARLKGGADGPGGVRFYPGDNGMRHWSAL